MTVHPNCRPNWDMLEVCEAAKRAARRNDRWQTCDGNDIHDLNGHRERKVVEFYVTMGRKHRTFRLTSGGVILYQMSRGWYPLELSEYGGDMLSAIEEALDSQLFSVYTANRFR